MMFEKLITEINESLQKAIINEWQWLIGADKEIVAITPLGDAFFSDRNAQIYWLDTGAGIFNKIADRFSEFLEYLDNSDVSDEWLLPDLLIDIKELGLKCQGNQVYSYKLLPIMGGEYKAHNFFCLDMKEHFAFTSHVHFQIKDLPDGTVIKLKTTD